MTYNWNIDIKQLKYPIDYRNDSFMKHAPKKNKKASQENKPLYSGLIRGST
jgi:hypothetical protein